MTRRSSFSRRTAILSVTSLLIASSLAAAQTPAASQGAVPDNGLVWSVDFAQRVTGRHLIITTMSGQRFEGTVIVSPTGLETAGKAGSSVPFGQIARIEKPTYRMRQGAWLGAAAGATLGIVVACANDRYCGEEGAWLAGGLFFGGIGAGAGAAIGAALNHAHKNDDVLYDHYRRPTTTVAVAPIVSQARKGVMVRVAWR
jgi:hypothetical protein